MPFGSKLSCALFNQFSTFLRWQMCKRSHYSNIIHYLEDFLFGGKSHDLTCQHTLLVFHQTCDQLGIPISIEKTVEPTTSLTFLGILLDTLSMQMRLLQDKLTELLTQIQHSLVVKKLTLQELSL